MESNVFVTRTVVVKQSRVVEPGSAGMTRSSAEDATQLQAGSTHETCRPRARSSESVKKYLEAEEKLERTQDTRTHDADISPEDTTPLSCESIKSENERASAYIASTKAALSMHDMDFNQMFTAAQEAILHGEQPELISEGSSGSYFVKDITGRIIGVFKPKDEEPFAPLNPKWPKFFQRIICFCCFGRACLIANAGYLSETGASVVDQRLHLCIVPKTRVVKMASPSFFYERTSCCFRRSTPVDPTKLKLKEGSLQTFVHGYDTAGRMFTRWEVSENQPTYAEHARFTALFQRMTVLDYVIRNTDRHMDNWLIRHIPGKELELAAIDNGLAFPVKHPEVASRLRQFPFKWQSLRWADEPWDETLRHDLLTRLTPQFVHDLCDEIKQLFRHDVGGSRLLVQNQLRVMRGQLWNLRHALLYNLTPAEMANLTPLLVKKRYRSNRPPQNAVDWSKYFKPRSAWQDMQPCCCSATRSADAPPLDSIKTDTKATTSGDSKRKEPKIVKKQPGKPPADAHHSAEKPTGTVDGQARIHHIKIVPPSNSSEKRKY